MVFEMNTKPDPFIFEGLGSELPAIATSWTGDPTSNSPATAHVHPSAYPVSYMARMFSTGVIACKL